MSRPLVSVITPTWQRHDLLLGAVTNVKAQDYPNIEHIIVSEGPDPELRHKLWAAGHRPADLFTDGGPTRLTFIELGRNWSSFLADSYCAAPVIAAQLMAAGELHSFLSDDERMAPDYLSTMVDALERDGTDFSYPRVAYTRWDMPGFCIGIGSDPPKLGSITTLVYRASALDKAQGPYRTHTGRANDWDFVGRLMAGGATWTFVDRVMFSHRDDRGCPSERYADPLPDGLTEAVGAP
jgi:GT2 family glycosyltransferase